MKRAKTIMKAVISCGLVLAALAVFSTFSVAQSAATKNKASKSWNAFWTKFSAGVRNKDGKALVALTTKHYHNAGGETNDGRSSGRRHGGKRLTGAVPRRDG